MQSIEEKKMITSWQNFWHLSPEMYLILFIGRLIQPYNVGYQMKGLDVQVTKLFEFYSYLFPLRSYGHTLNIM